MRVRQVEFFTMKLRMYSLKHTSGCEGVATDEKEGHTIDTNSDGLVLRRSKHLATTKKTPSRYTKL